MEPIKLNDIDLSEVDLNDDLLAPPITNNQKPKNPDMEITQEIEVVDDNE